MIITESGMERKTAAVARKLPRKHPNHYGGKENTDSAFAQNGGDCALYEERLVKDDVALELRPGYREEF